KVAVESIDLCMLFPLRQIEFAVLKAFPRTRIVEFQLARSKAAPLTQEFRASVSNLFRQIAIVVGKKDKRRGGRKFLALEQHRRSAAEQAHCSHRFVLPIRAESMDSPAVTGIRDLVVFLQKRHHCGWIAA